MSRAVRYTCFLAEYTRFFDMYTHTNLPVNRQRVLSYYLARVLERVRDAGPSWAEAEGPGPLWAEAEGPAAAGGAALVAKRGRGCGETFSGSPMRSGHVALSVS